MLHIALVGMRGASKLVWKNCCEDCIGRLTGILGHRNGFATSPSHLTPLRKGVTIQTCLMMLEGEVGVEGVGAVEGVGSHAQQLHWQKLQQLPVRQSPCMVGKSWHSRLWE